MVLAIHFDAIQQDPDARFRVSGKLWTRKEECDYESCECIVYSKNMNEGGRDDEEAE